MARIALFSLARARAFVARLEVDVGRTSICYACLSFVSFPLDDGDERQALSATRKMTPILWDEGLREYALAAVRHAMQTGVAEAEAAFADLDLQGGRSAVARALVLRLADDLTRRTRTEMRLEEAARDRLRRAPPGLN
ncbi:MAG: hypothetical protein ACXVZ4_12420 [Gaiellaceae bacterium]